MTASRKSGKNSHPNAVKNSLLARKPPRRRAPLRASVPPSSSNRSSWLNQEDMGLSHYPISSTSAIKKANNRPNSAKQPPQKRVKTRSPGKTNFSGSVAKGTNQVPVMPATEIMPTWLKRIHQLQRISSILTFALVSSTLAVYALNVYSQQSWGAAYNKLQNLQKIEQQLTTKNEVLKNKIAGEAEKASTGLVSPNPKEAIFISPASSSLPSKDRSDKPSTPSQQIERVNINQNIMGY